MDCFKQLCGWQIMPNMKFKLLRQQFPKWENLFKDSANNVAICDSLFREINASKKTSLFILIANENGPDPNLACFYCKNFTFLPTFFKLYSQLTNFSNNTTINRIEYYKTQFWIQCIECSINMKALWQSFMISWLKIFVQTNK